MMQNAEQQDTPQPGIGREDARARRLWHYVSEGRSHVVTGWLAPLINIVSLILIAYSAWYALAGAANQHFNGAIFAGVVTPMVFLTTTRNRHTYRTGPADYFLAAVSMLVFCYFVFNDDFYQNVMQGMTPIPGYETAIGLLAIALIFEACRRSIGWGLAAVMAILLAYTAFGQLLPGTLSHPGVDLSYFITTQTVTTEGLFGPALTVAATYAILFITFGTFFQRTGGGEMFFELASALIGNAQGGASKACVISSGLYGSISGSPVADVVTTGPVTIPLMKKNGVLAHRAAGIEAAAGCGGALLPPIMGSVAFVMVEYTAIPYYMIALAATIPAMLYYLGLLYGVHLESQRMGESSLTLPRRGKALLTLRRYWRHLVPIVVMCGLLALEYSAAYVAAGSMFVLIVVSWTNRKREGRLGLRELLEGSGETVTLISRLAAAVMASGVIIGCITLTGLTGKFSIMISMITGDHMGAALVVSAALLILLGMGMPTVSVYILGVALIAPVLTSQFGIPLLEAHMFMLFFSCLSAITPPLAVACFAAAAIANAEPMRTGVYACKVAFVGFAVPFYFVNHPGILISGSPGQIALDIGVSLLFVAAGAWALFGRGLGRELNRPLRIALAVLAILMTLPTGVLFFAGIAGFAVVTMVLFATRTRTIVAN